MGGLFSSSTVSNTLNQPYAVHELRLIIKEILFMNDMLIDKQIDWRNIKLDMIMFRDGLKHVCISFNNEKTQEDIISVVKQVKHELYTKNIVSFCNDLEKKLNEVVTLEITVKRQRKTNNTIDIGQYGIFGELTNMEQKLFDERAKIFFNPVLHYNS